MNKAVVTSYTRVLLTSYLAFLFNLCYYLLLSYIANKLERVFKALLLLEFIPWPWKLGVCGHRVIGPQYVSPSLFSPYFLNKAFSIYFYTQCHDWKLLSNGWL